MKYDPFETDVVVDKFALNYHVNVSKMEFRTPETAVGTISKFKTSFTDTSREDKAKLTGDESALLILNVGADIKHRWLNLEIDISNNNPIPGVPNELNNFKLVGGLLVPAININSQHFLMYNRIKKELHFKCGKLNLNIEKLFEDYKILNLKLKLEDGNSRNEYVI